MIMEATRPLDGTTKHGKVHLRVGQKVRHLGEDRYSVSSMRTVSLSPPTVSCEEIKFTLNPFIAASDLKPI